MEESLHLQNGSLFTRGPGNYKIPAFTDIPLDMRVNLFSESSNQRAVHSSKAVGEPPLFLGASAYFAVRDAILAARAQNGVNGHLRLDSPATPELVRMACGDRIAEIAKSIPIAKGEKPWAVRS
jgi:xanthine dehydrogenase/oxidase